MPVGLATQPPPSLILLLLFPSPAHGFLFHLSSPASPVSSLLTAGWWREVRRFIVLRAASRILQAWVWFFPPFWLFLKLIFPPFRCLSLSRDLPLRFIRFLQQVSGVAATVFAFFRRCSVFGANSSDLDRFWTFSTSFQCG